MPPLIFLTLYGPGLLAQAGAFAIMGRRFAWRWWEITLPWIASYAWWAVSGGRYGPTKSRANLSEIFLLSFLPGGYWLVRGIFFRKTISGGVGLVLAAVFAAFGLAVYFLVPTLPE
jgi:hypothetical protein